MQSGDTVFAFAPPSKESKFKAPRFQTDIALINPNNPDYAGRDAAFVIDGPGEYEVGGIHIKGISNPTIYTLSIENINLCHLGPFDEKNLTPEIKEEIGEVDILFIPVAENDGEKTSQVISQIEPKIAIPTSHKGVKPEEKLTIKKKDLSEGKTQIIVLSPVI